jgi:amidase/aspartyl-tRNA(Asn)/glutamyl-tRNA(Gln) amidotransferase subunit A
VPAFTVVGAEVDEVTIDLRHTQRDLAALWCRQMGVLYANTVAEFKQSGIDLLGEHRATMTPEFVAMVEAVQDLSAVAYMRDDTIRTDVFDAVQDVFDTYDLLVTPTVAVPPFDNASDGTTVGPTVINGQDVDPLIGWCLTYPLNFTGHPAASIPAGFTPDGLPVGMQVVGRRFADAVVLAASAAFERVRPWFPAYGGPASGPPAPRPAPRDLGRPTA